MTPAQRVWACITLRIILVKERKRSFDYYLRRQRDLLGPLGVPLLIRYLQECLKFGVLASHDGFILKNFFLTRDLTSDDVRALREFLQKLRDDPPVPLSPYKVEHAEWIRIISDALPKPAMSKSARKTS
jgi:hypothetical protein